MFKRKYNELIENAKKQNRKEKSEYYEEHHIIPRSLGGTNEKSNLVLLTPEEHYNAHYYLWKFSNTVQMANAFWLMCNLNGVKISKEEYGELRRQAALISAKNKSKPVYCLELDSFFPSCKKATFEVTGEYTNSQYIGQVCNKQLKAAFEWKNGLRYHWCWAEEAEEFKKHKDELLYEEAHKKEITNKNISEAKKGKPHKGISVICFELNKRFNTIQEAAKFCNGNYDILKKNAIEGYPYHNYHWILETNKEVELKEKRCSNFKGKHFSEESKKKLAARANIQKIKCKEENITFNNGREAAKWLKKHPTTGSYLIKMARLGLPCYGYHWELLSN